MNYDMSLLAATVSTWADWATIVATILAAAALVRAALVWVWKNVPRLFPCLGCRRANASAGAALPALSVWLQKPWWKRAWFDLGSLWRRRWCESHWCYAMAGRRWVRRYLGDAPAGTIETVVGKPPVVTVTPVDPGPLALVGGKLVPAPTITGSRDGWQAACNACDWQLDTATWDEATEALNDHGPCYAKP